ncbi:MAG TPA: HEAT repeat domain-containing protein [Ignavibacteriales bacterium]|nr:HEAT repeat domain-containing protein [Ignavibacteriales bacterium]
MNNFSNLNEQELRMLSSANPSERRMAVEDLMSKELDEEGVRILSRMLLDPDKGVRDSASLTLIFNGSPLIPKHVVPLISSGDIAIRNLAGEILLRIKDASLSAMNEYLDGANDDDQKFLIDIMGLIGSSKPVEKILQVLSSSSNDNVILSCIEALGNIQYSGAIPALIKIYETNELYKPTIAEALGKMNSKEALDFLLAKYHIEDDLTKFSIIESLGHLGEETTFYFLLSELRKIKGPLVWPVIGSLYELKEKFQLELPFDESIKHSVVYTLTDAEPRYKKAAASLITVFDDKDIMDTLIRVYGEDSEIDESIRPAFYKYSKLLYSKLPDIIRNYPSNLSSLLLLLRDITEFENMETLNVLSELDKRNLSDAVALCLNNPGEEVRRTAIELLFLMSLDYALLFIDSMIEDDNIWNRLKVLEMTENIFTPKINEILKKMIQDPEEMIRERAGWILSQRGVTDLSTKTE